MVSDVVVKVGRYVGDSGEEKSSLVDGYLGRWVVLWCQDQGRR